jgi:delta-aminolevulinic acid dehydratase/porphobilinogen synthase
VRVRNNEKPIEVKSMPGIVQYGVSNIEECLEPIVNKGLKSVLLFAVEHGIPKVGNYYDFFKIKALSYV